MTTVATPQGGELTEREAEVCARLGDSNEEIAEALSISVNTVRNHLKNVMRKTGLENRTQVALWYERARQS